MICIIFTFFFTFFFQLPVFSRRDDFIFYIFKIFGSNRIIWIFTVMLIGLSPTFNNWKGWNCGDYCTLFKIITYLSKFLFFFYKFSIISCKTSYSKIVRANFAGKLRQSNKLFKQLIFIKIGKKDNFQKNSEFWKYIMFRQKLRFFWRKNFIFRAKKTEFSKNRKYQNFNKKIKFLGKKLF